MPRLGARHGSYTRPRTRKPPRNLPISSIFCALVFLGLPSLDLSCPLLIPTSYRLMSVFGHFSSSGGKTRKGVSVLTRKVG